MSAIIGVVADTHGLIRPELLDALSGVSHVIHAGDAGSPDVVEALARIAPLTVVRGNNDRGTWAESFARSEVVEVESARILVLHNLAELELDPVTAHIHAVVAGHFHQPSIETRDGVLYLNPGSAGPRRFNFAVTLALLRVDGEQIDPEIVHLGP